MRTVDEPRYPPCFHRMDSFHSKIEKERLRSDRSCSAFALLLYDVGNTSSDNQRVCCLIKALMRRKRFTDLIGCFDDKTIGIILLACPERGAKKFILDIQQLLLPYAISFSNSIHIYPQRAEPFGNAASIQQLSFPQAFVSVDKKVDTCCHA